MCVNRMIGYLDCHSNTGDLIGRIQKKYPKFIKGFFIREVATRIATLAIPLLCAVDLIISCAPAKKQGKVTLLQAGSLCLMTPYFFFTQKFPLLTYKTFQIPSLLRELIGTGKEYSLFEIIKHLDCSYINTDETSPDSEVHIATAIAYAFRKERKAIVFALMNKGVSEALLYGLIKECQGGDASAALEEFILDIIRIQKDSITIEQHVFYDYSIAIWAAKAFSALQRCGNIDFLKKLIDAGYVDLQEIGFQHEKEYHLIFKSLLCFLIESCQSNRLGPSFVKTEKIVLDIINNYKSGKIQCSKIPSERISFFSKAFSCAVESKNFKIAKSLLENVQIAPFYSDHNGKPIALSMIVACQLAGSQKEYLELEEFNLYFFRCLVASRLHSKEVIESVGDFLLHKISLLQLHSLFTKTFEIFAKDIPKVISSLIYEYLACKSDSEYRSDNKMI